jgi:hypothetical protein
MNPNQPIYFYCPDERKVLKGRLVHVTESGITFVSVMTEQIDALYNDGGDEQRYNFTNDQREAIADGVDHINSLIKEHKKELTQLYKDRLILKYWTRP